jgi:hypothetical protein
MFGFINNIIGSSKKGSFSVEEFDYTLSVLEASIKKAHSSETVRASVLDMARKLKSAMTDGNGTIPTESKLKAIEVLNRVKVHALASDKPEDYALFVSLDRLTQNINKTPD